MNKVFKKGTLLVLLFSLATAIIFASCGKGDTMCNCRTYVPYAKNHFILGNGKRIKWDDAYKKCQEIQRNTRWDTCEVVEMR
jgi:hypothetical protein